MTIWDSMQVLFVKGRCSHKHTAEMWGTYSKLLTLWRFRLLSIVRCDVCKTLVLKCGRWELNIWRRTR